MSLNPAQADPLAARRPLVSCAYLLGHWRALWQWGQIVFALNWSDPQTQWLTVTNIVLGAVVAVCLIVIAAGIAHEVVSRIRKRWRLDAEIDSDMHRLFDDRTFDVAGLGITMADGGEKRPPPGQKDKH